MNTQNERENSLSRLRGLIQPGSTVYVLLRRKNSLGTIRWLEFYVVHETALKRVTWDVAQAIDGTYCRRFDALQVGGCGLDVGFSSVDYLSQTLFQKGGALTHQWL